MELSKSFLKVKLIPFDSKNYYTFSSFESKLSAYDCMKTILIFNLSNTTLYHRCDVLIYIISTVRKLEIFQGKLSFNKVYKLYIKQNEKTDAANIHNT